MIMKKLSYILFVGLVAFCCFLTGKGTTNASQRLVKESDGESFGR